MYTEISQYIRTVCHLHNDIACVAEDNFHTIEDISKAFSEWPLALVEIPEKRFDGDDDLLEEYWQCAVAILLHGPSDDKKRVLYNQHISYLICNDLMQLIRQHSEQGVIPGHDIKRMKMYLVPQMHGDNLTGWRLEVSLKSCEIQSIDGKFSSEEYTPFSFDYTATAVTLPSELDYTMYVDGEVVDGTTATDTIDLTSYTDDADIYIETTNEIGQLASARFDKGSIGVSIPLHYNPYI